MTKIAILGFGVVGSGTAKLITDNYKSVSSLGGDDIEIKYILDLRDFPDSPFADKVVHDFEIILSDPEISVVIEVMGGSHPAYEFTTAALKAGKSVITSNKEVVANFGDEFLALAKENGVSYRFEAAVGGGIPVIAPFISCVKQNKIREVRGILNGTTNYILTKMFVFGESFETALLDAQKKGYAERNPDADILGTDACRKITILSAIATESLYSPSSVYTEGITKIRSADVKRAESIGCTIKLVGRCIMNEDKAPFVMVAPFLIPEGEPLSGVSGVYNAVEIVAEPLGNVMFYGQGAGAGATASAVVGDLCQIMQTGKAAASPVFEKKGDAPAICDFVSEKYISVPKAFAAEAKAVFGEVRIICDDDEFAFITEPQSESVTEKLVSALPAAPSALIRILK